MGLFSKLFNKEMEDTTSETSIDYSNESFNMTIEDVFTIGSGTIVTGIIDSGEIHIGDNVIINGINKSAEVIGIEMFRKHLDYAKAGDKCGLLLKGISKDDVKCDDCLTK